MKKINSDNKTGNKNENRRLLKILKKALLWTVAIWAVILIVIQVALSPAILNKVARNFTNEFIDANVEFGKVSVSVLRNFPNLSISFDTVSISYPTEKFAGMEHGSKKIAGRGNGADTLMSFSKFSASVNIPALAAGQIRIPSLVLEKPRIFAENYGNENANWNIFKTADSEDSDTTSAEMPDIILGKIRFSNKPLIIYNSPSDTTSILLRMKSMLFNGRLALGDFDAKKVELKLDSMFVAGRFPSDTVALNLESLSIGANGRQVKASAKAATYMATKSYGRIKIPIILKTGLSFPNDTVPVIKLEKFKAEIADIPLTADAEIRFYKNAGLYIKGDAAIEKCKINDVLKHLEGDIWKELSHIQTDAVINMKASCDGYYYPESKKLPEITAVLDIPESTVNHKKYGTKNNITLHAGIGSDKKGRMKLELTNLALSGKAMSVNLNGSAEDIIGNDPLFNINAEASVSLDTLNQIIKQNSGISAKGGLRAKLKGKVYMSQIDPYKFSEAQIGGYLKSDMLKLKSEKDSLDLYADKVSIWLGAVDDDRDSSLTSGHHVLALVSSVDSLNFKYKDEMYVTGKKLSATAANSASILDKADTSAFYPFEGKMSIGFLSLVGADTTAVYIANSNNTFSISPKKDNPEIPLLDLKSHSDGIFIRGAVNRIGISGLKLDTKAAMNSIERKQKAKKYIDSLAKEYPDIPRDSLFIHLRKTRSAAPVPQWLKESDFKKNDLHLDIDSSFRKIFMEWDADGSMKIAKASIINPYFPLRNTLQDFEGSFDNDRIAISNLALSSGTSNIRTNGMMLGLRGIVAGNGLLKLDLEVDSDSLNLNELLGAYAAGAKFNPEKHSVSVTDDMDDSKYQELIVTDTLANTTSVESSLIVIPANINMKVSLNAANVKYSNLKISELKSMLAAKERCIQFTNTIARSEIGNIDFAGFYATRSKEDLNTGFDLHLTDITAEKVIELMPSVDSVIPMLKSFKGNLNCELAATAKIDTNMNIITPTIKGVIRIAGKDLQMEDSETFHTIAKKLMFKDKTSGRIDKMSVEGLIENNKLEIFPFVLNIDRYQLAMSGIQNLDMSFRYHISVLDSPIPFRLGVDIYGDNFDDLKFKIGKAKYKNANVPAFSSVVDQTRLNLKESINKIFYIGVDRAIKQNAKMGAISEYKRNINYTQAVDQKIDSLSVIERRKMEMDNNGGNDNSGISDLGLSTVVKPIKQDSVKTE